MTIPPDIRVKMDVIVWGQRLGQPRRSPQTFSLFSVSSSGINVRVGTSSGDHRSVKANSIRERQTFLFFLCVLPHRMRAASEHL